MSTTFGILIKKSDINEYSDNVRSEIWDREQGFIIVPIAFRSNGIRFINPIAHLLPDELEVIPMDNSNQGIYCIGDIKKQIESSS